jgi:hypothetical protein
MRLACPLRGAKWARDSSGNDSDSDRLVHNPPETSEHFNVRKENSASDQSRWSTSEECPRYVALVAMPQAVAHLREIQIFNASSKILM